MSLRKRRFIIHSFVKNNSFFSEMDSRKKINEEILRKRENDFTLGNVGAVKLPSYNALMDPNMRHYFENKHTQYLLYKTGQIDKHGRVIDLEKNKSKLFILEKEFATAEKLEEQRQKEEMEMRVKSLLIIEHSNIITT